MSLRCTSFVKPVLVASSAIFLMAAFAFAQAPTQATYKEYPPDAKLVSKKKDIQKRVGLVLRGAVPFDETAKLQLDAYYKNLVFREFTTQANRGELSALRNEVIKDLRSARKNTPAFQHVVTLSLSQMRSFTQSKFQLHPVVRCNAMLLIADLNATEIGTPTPNGSLTKVPDPLSAALDVLVAEYQSPDQIDAVRVAALVGIDRHVKLDLARPKDRAIPVPKKKVILDEMISLLTAAPPAGRTAEGHIWMQRRAIDILAVLGAVGNSSEANAALEKIVADKDAPISLRCTASEALAQWTPNSREKIDAGTVSHDLGMIAVKVCKDELDRIAALERYEKDLKDLRELIKKPHPAATGQFGQMPGGTVGYGTGVENYGGGGEMYGGAEAMTGGPGMEDMYGGGGEMYGGMGGMYGGMGGMYGGMGGVGAAAIPTDPRIIWSRRRLKYQLTCVKRGLDGMTVAGKASEDEKDVEKIKSAVEAALALTDPSAEKPTLEGMSESIRKGVLGLAFLAPEVAEIAAEPVTDLPSEIDPATPAAPPAVDPTAADPAVADPAVAVPAVAAPVAPGAPAAPAVDPLADPAVPPALPPGLE